MHPPDVRRYLQGSFDFEEAAQQVWAWQLEQNEAMASFARLLSRKERFFFPVQFFRDYEMRCGRDWSPDYVFRSSGTTGQRPSVHAVRDGALYHESALAGFRRSFGDHSWRILALLPGYLERPDASLVEMVRGWTLHFGLEGSGFFLRDHLALAEALDEARSLRQRVLLIGVAHALLDFAEAHPLVMPGDSLVMETGGMKGRRNEITRAELHERLCQALAVNQIATEYGMTEMLSQAYATSDGKLQCPPWMRITITDLHHPWREAAPGETGRICITDLMNVHSCAFLRTDDLGRLLPDGTFEVLGRVDHSELRGCSLMLAE